MKLARSLALAALVVPALPAAAAPEEGDRALGHMLALVHSVVRIAAHAESPQESLRALDEVLAGRNAEVNRAVMGLFDEMTVDLSARNRDRMAAIGRDLATIGRKDLQRKPSVEPLRARKDLNAMGLRYYDERQFPRRGEAQRRTGGRAVRRRARRQPHEPRCRRPQRARHRPRQRQRPARGAAR